MSTYIEDLEETGVALKMGRKEISKKYPQGYIGTYVFETYKDAEDFICKMSYKPEGFEVFGIIGDWDVDTIKLSETCKWRVLREDKEYFSLPKQYPVIDK
jgi:hypothetical protein